MLSLWLRVALASDEADEIEEEREDRETSETIESGEEAVEIELARDDRRRGQRDCGDEVTEMGKRSKYCETFMLQA